MVTVDLDEICPPALEGVVLGTVGAVEDDTVTVVSSADDPVTLTAGLTVVGRAANKFDI